MTLVEHFLREKKQHVYRGGHIDSEGVKPHQTSKGDQSVGIWFSSDKDYAQLYAEHVYDNDFSEADIDSDDPLAVSFLGREWDNGPYKPGEWGLNDYDNDGKISTNDVALNAYYKGNDCAIIKDVRDYDMTKSQTEYAVLDTDILSNEKNYSLYDD